MHVCCIFTGPNAQWVIEDSEYFRVSLFPSLFLPMPLSWDCFLLCASKAFSLALVRKRLLSTYSRSISLELVTQQSVHGGYLTADPSGRLYSTEGKGAWGRFDACRDVMEGYLKKKTNSRMKKWQKRWFRLSEHRLTYWQSRPGQGAGREPPRKEWSVHYSNLDTSATGQFCSHLSPCRTSFLRHVH